MDQTSDVTCVVNNAIGLYQTAVRANPRSQFGTSRGCHSNKDGR